MSCIVVTNSCNFFLNDEGPILKGNLRKELVFETVVSPTLDLTKSVEVEAVRAAVARRIDRNRPVATNNLTVVDADKAAISEGTNVRGAKVISLRAELNVKSDVFVDVHVQFSLVEVPPAVDKFQ